MTATGLYLTYNLERGKCFHSSNCATMCFLFKEILGQLKKEHPVIVSQFWHVSSTTGMVGVVLLKAFRSESAGKEHLQNNKATKIKATMSNGLRSS